MKPGNVSPILIAAGFVAFLGLGFWNACVRVTNEIGPIGADKDGRQILLQSLDAYLASGADSTADGYVLRVTSEFHDRSLITRALQEPMRTTFRLEYRIKDRSRSIDVEFAEDFLAMPVQEFLAMYRGPVSLRADWEVPPDSLLSTLMEHGAQSVAELLRAFGFTQFIVVVDGDTVFNRSLPAVGRDNVKWVGE